MRQKAQEMYEGTLDFYLLQGKVKGLQHKSYSILALLILGTRILLLSIGVFVYLISVHLYLSISEGAAFNVGPILALFLLLTKFIIFMADSNNLRMLVCWPQRKLLVSVRDNSWFSAPVLMPEVEAAPGSRHSPRHQHWPHADEDQVIDRNQVTQQVSNSNKSTPPLNIVAALSCCNLLGRWSPGMCWAWWGVRTQGILTLTGALSIIVSIWAWDDHNDTRNHSNITTYTIFSIHIGQKCMYYVDIRSNLNRGIIVIKCVK